jgi:hypothetical protein
MNFDFPGTSSHLKGIEAGAAFGRPFFFRCWPWPFRKKFAAAGNTRLPSPLSALLDRLGSDFSALLDRLRSDFSALLDRLLSAFSAAGLLLKYLGGLLVQIINSPSHSFALFFRAGVRMSFLDSSILALPGASSQVKGTATALGLSIFSSFKVSHAIVAEGLRLLTWSLLSSTNRSLASELTATFATSGYVTDSVALLSISPLVHRREAPVCDL